MGMIKCAILAAAAALTAASANAEDCKAYPAGPKRFACASARYPDWSQSATNASRRPKTREYGLAVVYMRSPIGI